MPKKGPDIDKLIAEVAARHGVLLKPDDAAFALVTLNELVLERSLDEIDTRIRDAVAHLEASAVRLQAGAGAAIGRELRNALGEMRDEMAAARQSARRWQWISGAAVLVALLVFAAGVYLGTILL